MRRTLAAVLAASLISGGPHPAAGAPEAQAAEPFPEVEFRPPPRRPHLLAYASIVAGVAMIGGSFPLANRANHTYRDYLAATEPDLIEKLYDETVRFDRLSSGALLGGEVLIATGLYLRFLRSAPPERLGISIGPRRCAIAWRF